MTVTEREFARATTRMEARREDGHAAAARYDSKGARIVVEFDTGVQIAFPVARTEGLAGASAADLAEIEISPSGLGLHWPRLDADVYLPALLQGVFGSRHWMAARLGAAGGQSRSPAKTAASRENGRKGGRPRKAVSG